MTLKPQENGKYLLGTGQEQVETRLVSFSSLDNQSEYRLVTNLSESEITYEEIAETYPYRWGIETLWKFLKMHLKLYRLMTKNENGIRHQIYPDLIVYML